MTREELYGLLEQRMREPHRAAEIDAAIWAAAGAERAVLVSDLTGFTRIAHESGILHFLSHFRHVVGCAEPLFRRHGASFWKTEADDLMAAFPDVGAALETARTLAAVEVGEVGVCLGVAWGRILVLEDDLFGDAVNLAYKLGEDLACRGEVLVSADAAARVQAPLEGPLSVDLGGMNLPYYRLVR